MTKKSFIFMFAGLTLIAMSCTKETPVKPDSGNGEKPVENVVPGQPGFIVKTPESLSIAPGETMKFTISPVKGAKTYEWTIGSPSDRLLSITNGQGTVEITVKAGSETGTVSAGTISVTAANDAGKSEPRKFAAEIEIIKESYQYRTKLYGTKTWMVENCREGGEDGSLGVTEDLTQRTDSKLSENVLSELNQAQGRYYTWFEAMTGIPSCTAEQCPYKPGYTGTDATGKEFTMDGGESEMGAQIQGCCPEGWHVANMNDWWDLLVSIKSEYNVPDNFVNCGFTFEGGHDGKPENAITKEIFYKNGCTVKNMGNVGAWLRGGNGRILDGGVWNTDKEQFSDAGENLNQFTDGAVRVGFGWYPLSHFRYDKEPALQGEALGKWGYFWFIRNLNENHAYSLCISGTSMNLNMMNRERAETVKTNRLNVRCVKNY